MQEDCGIHVNKVKNCGHKLGINIHILIACAENVLVRWSNTSSGKFDFQKLLLILLNGVVHA